MVRNWFRAGRNRCASRSGRDWNRGDFQTSAFICLAVISFGSACGPLVSNQTPTATSGWHAERLAGVPGGFRAVTYDASRNCLWIVTRTSVQADVLKVRLTRFNISDGSTVPSLLELPTTGAAKGSVAVDSQGLVWLTWGRTLIRYDPDATATQSWALPVLSSVRVHPSVDPVLDGNAVALAVAGDGEVWLAAQAEQALFGFNPTLAAWDRNIPLPVVPTPGTRLSVLKPGLLTLNALQGAFPVMAVVSTTTSGVSVLPPHVGTYVLVGTNEAVYLDENRSFGKLDLISGQSTMLASSAPLGGAATPAVDLAGNLWFSMVAYHSVGIGKLNLTSGVITSYPFPAVVGASPAGGSCPTTAFHCVNPDAVFNPDVQAIVVDGSNNVWVINRLPDTGPPTPSVISPMYELPAGS